jgi:hypothetical protein
MTEATWEGFFHKHESMEAPVAELRDGWWVSHTSSSIEARRVDTTRQGHRAAHLEAVYAHVKVADAQRIYWHVLPTNARAVRGAQVLTNQQIRLGNTKHPIALKGFIAQT